MVYRLFDWDWPSAERECLRSVALNPGYAPAWLFRGNVLQGLLRYDQALQSYDRFLALVPGSAEAWNNRGTSLQSLGRIEEALESIRRALSQTLEKRGMRNGRKFSNPVRTACTLVNVPNGIAITVSSMCACALAKAALRSSSVLPSAMALK